MTITIIGWLVLFALHQWAIWGALPTRLSLVATATIVAAYLWGLYRGLVA